MWSPTAAPPPSPELDGARKPRWPVIATTVAVVIGIVLLLSGAALAEGPSLARGAKLFKKCVHCHTVERGGRHRIGPNLHGMFGRKAGGVSGFDFSDAWKQADFVWTDKTLDTYLKAPYRMIPGNRMPFRGLNRAADRTDLIAYLKKVTRQ